MPPSVFHMLCPQPGSPLLVRPLLLRSWPKSYLLFWSLPWPRPIIAVMTFSRVVPSVLAIWPSSFLFCVESHLSHGCRPWIPTELVGKLEVTNHTILFLLSSWAMQLALDSAYLFDYWFIYSILSSFPILSRSFISSRELKFTVCMRMYVYAV